MVIRLRKVLCFAAENRVCLPMRLANTFEWWNTGSDWGRAAVSWRGNRPEVALYRAETAYLFHLALVRAAL